MELWAVWHLIRRRWWVIALPALAALAVSLPRLQDMIDPPVTYVVPQRLTAGAPPTAGNEQAAAPYEDSVYVPLLACEYVVVNLPHWITSDSFAAEVQQVLAGQGMVVETGDLAFAADSFRCILNLYTYWDDAAEIQAVADAAMMVLQTRSQAYFPQFAAEPVQVVPFDAAEVVEVAPPITTRLNPLLRIGIGFAAGVALAVLAEYLDRTIRSRSELEALGLPVIAEIPPERKR